MMRPKAALPLWLRLTLFTGLLTGGTLLLFALVFYLALQRNLHNAIDTRLRDRAALLMRTAPMQGGGDSSSDLPLPAPLVEFEAPGIYAELIAPDGTIRAVSPNLPSRQLPTDAMLIASARAGRPMFTTLTVGADEQLRLLAVPGRDALGSVLVVAESLEPLDRTLQRTQSLLLGGSALAVTLALAGATLLTRRALAPIGELTRAAARIAGTREYQTRVPLPPHRDEVGQLAAMFNALIMTVERTVEQQRQFLADTSHELRSPLTVILANLDLLRRGLDAPNRELSLHEATAEAQRMRRLVNDLLLLARTDAARSIDHAPVRLDRLVEETAAIAARQAPDHDVQVFVEEPMVIIGDKERLTQLLRNLIENATRHTPPGAYIAVRLRRSDGLAQLSVADTGPGIPAEHLPRIWDRFYRADKMRSRAVGGSGLGLAIVKYVAEAHGGSVEVHSHAETGTTFVITLPLAADLQPLPNALAATAET
jgi:heavy metal sensor kinase